MYTCVTIKDNKMCNNKSATLLSVVKKNEGKEYKKKSDNKIFKDYRNKIKDEIDERKEDTLQYVKKDFVPFTSAADFRNQLREAVQKNRTHINKIKRGTNKKQNK